MSSFLILPIVVSFISSPVGTNPYIKEIGYYGKTWPVEEQRIYLETAEERDMIPKLGRSVNVEINNTGHGVTTRYYYNASIKQGKVLEARQIRNDVDSFAYMVGQVECYSKTDYVSQFGDSINSTLGYIRTINKNYESVPSPWCPQELAFESVCGSYNPVFNDWIDEDVSHNLNIPDYFGSFVNSQDLNHISHSKARFSLHGNGLIDPANPTKTIDMVHFVTVMDGVYADTGGVIFDRETLGALVSWAGDLQDATRTFKGSEYDFEDVVNLDSSISPCSYEDLIADIDGLAIGKSIKSSGSLEQTIRDYYHLLEVGGNNYRFTSFIGTLGYEYNHNYRDLVKGFEKRVFDMLALKLDDDGNISDNYSLGYKYYLLSKVFSLPSVNQRFRMGKSFIDYVLKKANMVEEIELDENKIL